MENLHIAKHDDNNANPFGIREEGPMPRGAHILKINPKVPESTDLGVFGTRHPNDWG